jgi:hypothetical protein
LKKLRRVGADGTAGTAEMVLWRGMKNLKPTDEFISAGGTELGCLSTTSNLEVAVEYSISGASLLFKLAI